MYLNLYIAISCGNKESGILQTSARILRYISLLWPCRLADRTCSLDKFSVSH